MAVNTAKYGDLLHKNVLEELPKNWSYALASYLDDYIAHCQGQDEMNFAEAALLVQNSTSCYCKRVDVVHKIVQELLVEVNNLKASDNEPKKPSVKRKAKSLELDDLQVMDFVASQHSIDIHSQNNVCPAAQAQIVLCTSMKALRKAGTSVSVYQSNGNVLGLKEEFRIFFKTCSDGTVNEEFMANDGLIIDCNNECQGGEELDDIREDSFLMDNEEMAPEPILPEPQSELSTRIPEVTELPLSPSYPMATREFAAARKPKQKKNFEWQPIPSELNLVTRIFKEIKRSELPKMLESEEIEEKDACYRKKRKRKKGQEEFLISSWIGLAVDDMTAQAFRTQAERKVREEMLRKKTVRNNNLVDEFDPILEADDSHEPDDFDNIMDDFDTAAARAAPMTMVDQIINEDDANLFTGDLDVIEKYKASRREFASTATALAQKVAEWHESIKPVLDAAESRSKFDVHDYGSKILTVFPDDDCESFRPFRSVVIDQPKNEICRYFLSTLMLANTYNLEIRKSSQEPLVKDCLELRLITKSRHHEEMDEALRIAAEDCGV